MSVLYIALPVALLLGALGCLACVFCIRRGQYDDLQSPSVRMLIDDEPIYMEKTSSKEHQGEAC